MFPKKSSVQIEVLNEEEYAEELQREREAQSQRLAEAKANKLEKEAITAAASSPSKQKPTAPESSFASVSSSPSAEPPNVWRNLLSSLQLPLFFHTLHDTRIYDQTTYQTQMARDLPAFQRSCLVNLTRLRQLVKDASTNEFRSIVPQLLLSCMKFLLPPLPITPTMLSASQDDSDDSTAAPVIPYEFLWQTNELSLAAANVIKQIAERIEDEEVDEAPNSPSNSLPQKPTSGIEAILTTTRVRSLFSRSFPAIVQFLRAEMRTGSPEAHIAPWKSAQRFPSPFIITFIMAYIPPSALADQIGDVIPLILPLANDHEMRFKIAGLSALQRLLQVVSGSSFPTGTGLLLLNSLKICLSYRERAIVALSVPTYIQAYMTFFPSVIIHDTAVIQRLAIAEGLSEAQSPPSTSFSFGSGPSSPLTPAAASIDLRDRVGAQSQLLTTLLQEATYFTLSPSTENAFALFIHAQSLLPTLLYVGPFTILPHLRQLLSLVTTWATFTDAHHSHTNLFAWQILEALLVMQVVNQRMVTYLGQLIETATTGWIQGIQRMPSVQLIPTTADSHRAQSHHPHAPSIISVMRLLHQLEPNQFDQIWCELKTLPDLASLDQAIKSQA